MSKEKEKTEKKTKKVEDGQQRGPFSRDERDYIFDNSQLDDKEIAKTLRRNPKHVRKVRAEKEHWMRRDEKDDFIKGLRGEHFWKKVKEKLMEDEVEYFEESWADLSTQFSAQGILPTDKHAMQDLIITDILLHRHQKEEKDIRVNISKIGEEMMEEMEKGGGRINSEVKYLQKCIDGGRATLNSLVKGNTELQRTKDSKFKDLKATRAQRLDKIERGGKTFFDCLRLLNEKESRHKEGQTLAISRHASGLSSATLQEYYEYEDDSVDKPFLFPEKEDEE